MKVWQSLNLISYLMRSIHMAYLNGLNSMLLLSEVLHIILVQFLRPMIKRVSSVQFVGVVDMTNFSPH